MNMITTIVRSGEAARTVVGENTAYALVARTGAEAARDATVTARDVVLAAIDVDYASLAAATAGAANGAFFTYRDASGNPIYATKTGGVVTELPGPWFSSAKVGFLHSTGMVETDLAEVARRFGKVSVLNFITDVSLWAEIQSYTYLLYTTDHTLQTYIQAAIDWCQRNRCVLYFPRGYYRITASLTVYGTEDFGATIIEGDSEYTSIIDMANEAADVFVNGVPPAEGGVADPGSNFRQFTLRNIAVRNGRWAVFITRTGDQVTSLLHFQNVRFEYQNTGAFRNSQYLITCLFENVVFYYCESAVYSGRNANNVTMIKPRFEGLDGDIIELASPGGSVNGCENFRLIDPRFEAHNDSANVTGKRVIKGYRLSNLLIDGGYFENTHVEILAETGSLGLVKFKDVHFTGQQDIPALGAGFKPEVFTSNGIVTFDTCRFNTGSNGAASMLLIGQNFGLRTETSHIWWALSPAGVHVKTKPVAYATGVAESLFTITRDNGAADVDNRNTLCGTIQVTAHGHVGGTYFLVNKVFSVSIYGFSTGNITLDSDLLAENGVNAVSATLTIALASVSATSATLQATVTAAGLTEGEVTAILDVAPLFEVDETEMAIAPVAA